MVDESEIPPHVLAFIETLGADDVKSLRAIIRIERNMAGWCRVTKYLFWGALATLVMISHGIDALKNIAEYARNFILKH